jgi:hypothetical protein
MYMERNMYKEKIVNIETGEETWRDYTPAEIVEVEAAQAKAAIKTQELVEAEAKRVAAAFKLAALGLDEDDLKALGL